MGGDRARIGLLWPADGRNDREFWRWLPETAGLELEQAALER